MPDMHKTGEIISEATVQLRSTGRKLGEDEFNSLRSSLDDVIENLSDDPMFFITNEGPVTGGYDVVMGSKDWLAHGAAT